MAELRPFTFTVVVTVNHVEGKFASRDEIADELRQAIEDADPCSVSAGEAEYETSSWSVDDA